MKAQTHLTVRMRSTAGEAWRRQPLLLELSVHFHAQLLQLAEVARAHQSLGQSHRNVLTIRLHTIRLLVLTIQSDASRQRVRRRTCCAHAYS